MTTLWSNGLRLAVVLAAHRAANGAFGATYGPRELIHRLPHIGVVSAEGPVAVAESGIHPGSVLWLQFALSGELLLSARSDDTLNRIPHQPRRCNGQIAL